MDYLADLIEQFSEYLRDHQDFLALGLSLCLFLIGVLPINRFLKQKCSSMKRPARVLSFLLLALFGYPWLVKITQQLLNALFDQLNDYTLAPVMLLTFVILAVLIEKDKS